MNQTKCQNETSLLLVIDDNANRQILGYNIFVVTWIRGLSENEKLKQKWMWVLVKAVDYYVKVINRDKSCGRMSEQQLNYAPFWRKSCLLAVGLLMGNIKTSETSLITNRMLSLNILRVMRRFYFGIYIGELFFVLIQFRLTNPSLTYSSSESAVCPLVLLDLDKLGHWCPSVSLWKRDKPHTFTHTHPDVCVRVSVCLCVALAAGSGTHMTVTSSQLGLFG